MAGGLGREWQPTLNLLEALPVELADVMVLLPEHLYALVQGECYLQVVMLFVVFSSRFGVI